MEEKKIEKISSDVARRTCVGIGAGNPSLASIDDSSPHLSILPRLNTLANLKIGLILYPELTNPLFFPFPVRHNQLFTFVP